MSDIFGGGQTIPSHTSTTSSPWSGVQPYLTDLFQRAQSQSNVAPFSYAASPFTTQAENLVSQTANNPNGLTSRAQSTAGNILSPEYLNPQTNPAFSSAVQDALGQARSAFAGQYGGAAGQNLGNSGYQEALARGLGAVATNAYANQYNNNAQQQLAAMQQAPGLDYANANALMGIGQNEEQRALNQYNSPFNNLSNYQKLIAGNFGGSSNTDAQNPFYTNPAATALGLGIGGLGLYNGAKTAGLLGAATPALEGGAGYTGLLGGAAATGGLLGSATFADMLGAGLIAL